MSSVSAYCRPLETIYMEMLHIWDRIKDVFLSPFSCPADSIIVHHLPPVLEFPHITSSKYPWYCHPPATIFDLSSDSTLTLKTVWYYIYIFNPARKLAFLDILTLSSIHRLFKSYSLTCSGVNQIISVRAK